MPEKQTAMGREGDTIMFQKWISVILSAIMALSLTACSQNTQAETTLASSATA